MNNGLLLVNAFHARPADFNDADPNIVSIGRYLGGNTKVQVKDYSRYDMAAFSEAHKKEVREKQFPKDLERAFRTVRFLSENSL